MTVELVESLTFERPSALLLPEPLLTCFCFHLLNFAPVQWNLKANFYLLRVYTF